MKETFKGDSPKNARIKIDYSGLKPDVKFSYPSKKKQSPGGALGMVLIFWFFIWLLLFFGYALGKGVYSSQDQNNVSYNISNYSDYVRYVEEEDIINKTYYSLYEEHSSTFSERLSKAFKKDIGNLYEMVFFILFFFIPLFTIYFSFRKFWVNLYPKFQAFLKSKKKAIQPP